MTTRTSRSSSPGSSAASCRAISRPARPSPRSSTCPAASTRVWKSPAAGTPRRICSSTLNYGYLDAHIKNGLTDAFGFQDTNDPAALLPTAHRLNKITCTTPSTTCIGGFLVDPITQQPQWTQDLSGNELPNAPHHKIAANVSYTFHIPQGNLTASYSYIWRSSAYSQPDVFEEKVSQVPAYDQSDARLIFRSKDSDYKIVLFGTNIFNQTTYELGGFTRRGSGYTPQQALACAPFACAQQQIYYPTYVLLPPRTFGIEINKTFR